MRSYAVLALTLCALFSVLPGCDGRLVSVSANGTWTMKLELNHCPLPGFLRGGVDYMQDAPISQNNGEVESNFQDNWGNNVKMWGTLSGGRYLGDWDVHSPGGRHVTVGATGNYSARFGTIDGMMVVTYDSEFECTGEQFPFWAIINGGATGSGGGVPVAGRLAFVGHGYSEDVDVVDIDTMTLVDTIVGAGGYRQVLTADNRTLYGTTGDAEMTISDAVSFTLTQAFDPAGPQPQLTQDNPPSSELEPIAISPDGTRVYVGDEQGSAGLFVLSVATNQIINTTFLPGVDEPENAVVSPNGQFLYMADNSEALKIDSATLQIVGRVTVGGGAHGIAVNSTGTRVYAEGNGSILAIDTSNMTVVATITAAGSSGYYLELSKDGQRLYGVNEGTRLTVIDTATATLIQNVVLSTGSGRGVTTTPGGGTILVATSQGLIKIDAATLLETGFLAGRYQSVVTQN